jgi:competence protein ComEC
MASRVGVFLVTLHLTMPLALEDPDRWTVWNVGQGQWVTLRTQTRCYHFDTGGEFAPWDEIIAECRDKQNILSYSHWDWDHISFAGRLQQALPRHCLLLPPEGNRSRKKAALFLHLDECHEPKPFAYWTPRSGPSANALSRIFFWSGVLIPGDSPIAQEKIWIEKLKNLEKTRWLVIGHHGSRTSTGPDLLKRLTHVRAAIASARRSRYGHPHPEVRRHLEERKIPLLTTEDWGHIHIYD